MTKLVNLKKGFFIKHQEEGIHSPQCEEEVVPIHDLLGIIKQMYIEVKKKKH